ncbi:hypothetical protein GA0115251_106818 [Streptomyces sp. TverLS-915]|nr:hypothetical protein GA0115251_106818 [Streptomyces sp. TverLS-915]
MVGSWVLGPGSWVLGPGSWVLGPDESFVVPTVFDGLQGRRDVAVKAQVARDVAYATSRATPRAERDVASGVRRRRKGDGAGRHFVVPATSRGTTRRRHATSRTACVASRRLLSRGARRRSRRLVARRPAASPRAFSSCGVARHCRDVATKAQLARDVAYATSRSTAHRTRPVPPGGSGPAHGRDDPVPTALARTRRPGLRRATSRPVPRPVPPIRPSPAPYVAWAACGAGDVGAVRGMVEGVRGRRGRVRRCGRGPRSRRGGSRPCRHRSCRCGRP